MNMATEVRLGFKNIGLQQMAWPIAVQGNNEQIHLVHKSSFHGNTTYSGLHEQKSTSGTKQSRYAGNKRTREHMPHHALNDCSTEFTMKSQCHRGFWEWLVQTPRLV
jgi:hypothetical protein